MSFPFNLRTYNSNKEHNIYYKKYICLAKKMSTRSHNLFQF